VTIIRLAGTFATCSNFGMRGKIWKTNVTILKRVLVLSFQVNFSLFIAG
jgi:hypothetical protein